jgi:hypothetical protein
MENTEIKIGDRTKIDCTLVYSGEAWRIIGVGAERDGNTYCHLANIYRGKQQKNGWNPIQICDWIDSAVVASATKLEAK